MRGIASGENDNALIPNSTSVEYIAERLSLTASGFKITTTNGNFNQSGENYIYIAIRRPMKVPESGTEVFSPNIWTGDGSPEVITTGFSPDVSLGINRGAVHASTYLSSRLTGMGSYLSTTTTAAENSDTASVLSMDGITINSGNLTSGFGGGQTYVGEFFKRAPSFMDVVCYTGTGATGNAIAHNLTVAPELAIFKGRSGLLGTNDWQVIANFTAANYIKMVLNTANAALGPYTYAINAGIAAVPTAETITVDNVANFNNGSSNYVLYLFATLAGVSKVGSYTGTAASLDLDMGFTGGARFFLCKRTDATGDWYTYDSSRGIVAGNDPYLLLNSTAAEVTNTDYVDPLAAGITLTAAGSSTINVSGGSYIFLAIA